MKTTFDLNFDLYQVFKQHGSQKRGNKEKLSRDRRLCNKDRDQGQKGISVIGIDHVETCSTSDK